MSRYNKRLLLLVIGMISLVLVWGVFLLLVRLHTDTKILQHNLQVARDSVKIEKLKNGELLASRDSYIVELKNSQDLLGISQKQIKELEKRLGSALAQLAKVNTKVQTDTIWLENNILIDTAGYFTSVFKYQDQWCTIAGKITKDNDSVNAYLDKIQFDVPLTIGQTKDYKFFVSSPNPYFNVTSVNSAVELNSVVQKKSHFGIGVGVGFGAFYGLNTQKFDLGIGATVGLVYKF